MADLHLGADARPVGTIFHLLGQDEDDLTRALAWALANSSRFLEALMVRLDLQFETGDTHRLRVQHPLRRLGRTDIEVETGAALVIFEAKLGWNLPGEQQVKTYEDRIHAAISDHVDCNIGQPVEAGALVTLSECSPAWAEQPCRPTAEPSRSATSHGRR